jgi:hypothetical protein
MVVTSRTVGNDMKSSGLVVCSPINSTIIDKAMLKVNKISRAKAGKGSTIIANNSTIMSGAEIDFVSNLLSQACSVGFIEIVPYSSC